MKHGLLLGRETPLLLEGEWIVIMEQIIPYFNRDCG
jgi:hypothetical protein